MLGKLLETLCFRSCGGRRVGTKLRLHFITFAIATAPKVDIVLERGAHEVAGIEVKAAATSRPAISGVYGNSRRPPVNLHFRSSAV